MDLEKLKELIKNNLTQREIAYELNTSQTNVRYWLKKYKLKTITSENKICPKCKKNKLLSEFYIRRGKEGGSVYCILCSNLESSERARRFKEKCVIYKGGKCEICEYNKYIGALQFHHLNPKEKDFALSSVKSHSFNETIKKELDKCKLVCANCHSEIHGSMV